MMHIYFKVAQLPALVTGLWSLYYHAVLEDCEHGPRLARDVLLPCIWSLYEVILCLLVQGCL